MIKHSLHIVGLILFGSNTIVAQDNCTITPSCIEKSDLEIDSFQYASYYGCPRLDCTYNDGICEFPKNRFLVRSSDQKYYICDSVLNVIVPKSDTIIAISRNCWDNYDIPCYTPDRRGGNKIMYQSISNGYTKLYDYMGNQLSTIKYKGVIAQFDYEPFCNTSYIRVFETSRTFHSPFWQNVKNGLIDTLGNQVIPIGNYLIHPFSFDSLWVKSDSINSILINVKQNKELLHFDTKNDLVDGDFENDLILFSQKDKFGIYHIEFGIVVPPNYDEIHYLFDEQYALYNKRSIRYKLKRGYKLWNVPEKILEYTPNIN